jgi:hypothetical protein
MTTAWYALPPEPRLIACQCADDTPRCHCTTGAMTWKPPDTPHEEPLSWLEGAA